MTNDSTKGKYVIPAHIGALLISADTFYSQKKYDECQDTPAIMYDYLDYVLQELYKHDLLTEEVIHDPFYNGEWTTKQCLDYGKYNDPRFDPPMEKVCEWQFIGGKFYPSCTHAGYTSQPFKHGRHCELCGGKMTVTIKKKESNDGNP